MEKKNVNSFVIIKFMGEERKWTWKEKSVRRRIFRLGKVNKDVEYGKMNRGKGKDDSVQEDDVKRPQEG